MLMIYLIIHDSLIILLASGDSMHKIPFLLKNFEAKEIVSAGRNMRERIGKCYAIIGIDGKLTQYFI